MLIEQIKEDQLKARVDGQKIATDCLTTLYSESIMIGKNDGNRQTTDNEVLKLIKKFMDNLNDFISICEKTNKSIPEKIYEEQKILAKYLPKQLNDEELIKIITDIHQKLGGGKEQKLIGSIMKQLSANYTNLYNGEKASQIVKSLIS